MTTATASRHPWFGLHLPSYSHPDVPPEHLFDRVVEQAKAAEAAGFELVTVMDHLYQIPGVGSTAEPMLEGWSVLSALARETETVRLGTLVTGVTYRNPAMLAKQVTTLDVVSGGRAILGLGAAWNEEEHIGYGIEFPPLKERMDRLEEALTIAKLMFTEERPSFEGKHYRLHEALNSPRPIQAGGPPILVGGGGEQRTLRIAAKFADMTHWFALGPRDAAPQGRAADPLLRGDRPRPVTIERTIGAPVVVVGSDAEAKAFLELMPAERRPYVVAGTPEQVVDALGRVHRGRVHGVHVQQRDLPDAGADRPRR